MDSASENSLEEGAEGYSDNISREEFLGQLPPGTHEYSYSGIEDMIGIVEQEEREFDAIHEKDSSSEYIIFSRVPQEVFDIENPDGRPISQRIKCYHRRLSILLLKMRKQPHEVAVSSFNILMTKKLIAMEALEQLHFLGQTTVDGSQRSKLPDSSYRPYTLPTGRTKHWPSFTVEVGYSESTKKLTEDAKWWLCDSQGEVRLVITINIHRGKQKKLDIQRWELGPKNSTRSNTGRTGPKVVEQVRISEQRGVENQLNFNVNGGGSITVPFERVFLRESSNPAEGDITFTAADLQGLAKAVFFDVLDE